MTSPAHPYPLPDALAPELKLVHAYWRALTRGANNMPFWDDVKPSALPAMSDRLMLIDAFDKPWRFRFGSVVGQQIEQRYGKELRGLFVDKIEPRTPFEELNSQCSATVTAHEPTHFRRERDASYSRLLLPMWGDGRIGMLLGAFVWR